MTPYRTPSGALALAVGPRIYLPSGRCVPLADTAFEECDADPEEATPACYAAALADEDAVAALGPPPGYTLPVLPRVEEPVVWTPDPAVAVFVDRCAALLARGEKSGSPWYTIRGIMEDAARTGVTEAMDQVLDEMERDHDPEALAVAAALCDDVAAWLTTHESPGRGFYERVTRDVRWWLSTQGHLSHKTRRELVRMRAQFDRDRAKATP